jgi:hypothetical protein
MHYWTPSVNDDQRDELLTELRVTVATLALTMKTVAERVTDLASDGRQERATLFELVGNVKKRLHDLEVWQGNLSGQSSARGSAWAASKWVVGTLIAVVGLCSGVISWFLSNL